MDLNELKGLSNEEAIKKAAAFAGVRPEILDGIWRTETGRGTHPTMIGPETKWGTAKGHFQQLDSVVNTWRQRTGKELDPFDFHDGLYMASLHLRENVKRYGNEEQAVLAYHGGTDPKNWGPQTQDYLRKVVGAAEVKTPTVSDKTAVPRHVLPEGFAAQLADLTPWRAVDEPAAAPAAPMPTIQRDPLQGDYMPAAEEGDFRARVSQQADALDTAAPAHTWSEKQDAAYTNEMEPWFNIARQWQDGGPEKDLAWMRYAAANDTEVFKDVPNEDDREFLREAVSAADLEYRKARLAERKANEDVTFRDGFWSGMGHTVGAGLRNPVTAVVDLLAGALTLGAGTVLMRGGRAAGVGLKAGRAGILARGAAEGAVGSIAVDGLLVMAGEYRSAADIAAGSIASAGLGTLFSVPTYRQASKRQLEEFESKVLSDMVGGKIETLRQAVDELGPEADPAVIARRASEIEAQRLKENVTAALNAAPEADRLPAAEVVPEAEDAGALDAASTTRPASEYSDLVHGTSSAGRDAILKDGFSLEPPTRTYSYSNFGRGVIFVGRKGSMWTDPQRARDSRAATYDASVDVALRPDARVAVIHTPADVASLAQEIGLDEMTFRRGLQLDGLDEVPEARRAMSVSRDAWIADRLDTLRREYPDMLDDPEVLESYRTSAGETWDHYNQPDWEEDMFGDADRIIAALRRKYDAVDFAADFEESADLPMGLEFTRDQIAVLNRDALQIKPEDAASRNIAGEPQALRSRINDDDIYAPFEDPAFLQRRKDAWAMREDWREGAYSRAPELDTLGAGVHISQTATPAVRAAADAITPILRKYLPPEAKVVIGTEVQRADVDGIVTSVGDLHVIGLRNDPNRPVGMLHTALHEGGHVVFHQWAQHIPTQILTRVNDAWLAYVKRLRQMDPDAVNDRFAVTSPNRTERLGKALPRTKYVENRGEWIAEQFVKYVQYEASKGTYGDVPKGIIDRIVTAVRNAVQFLLDATRTSKVKPEESVAEMFTWVLNNANKSLKEAEEFLDPSLRLPDLDAAAMPVGGFKGPVMLSPEKPRITGADYDFARKYGLDLMPQNTPLERATFKAVLNIYRKAEAWVAANPRLDERAQTLLNKSATFQITGTALASSENPVARMVAGTLLESTTGAQGRRNTAAIAADMHYRRFLGNAVQGYESAYAQWGKLHDASIKDNVWGGGTVRERFDRAVALEIEGRRAGRYGTDKIVARAADHIEAAYERMRAAQVQTGTVGYAMLPDTATGYMSHVLNKAKVIAMTPDELRTFVDIMTEQFQTIEGFDAKFSAELARKYVDRARVNANGGHEIPANINHPGAADMVRKALEDMGVGHEALVEMMQRFSRGGPSYTKQRLHLDLTREYPNGVKLLDLYDTNQLELLRRYARRVSGEVALAQFGVMGSQGLRLLRRALEFGPDADKPELRQAFDQVAAEFLGQPFGNATGKWMDRAMQVNSLARLGMTGLLQAGEMVNAVAHIGVLQSLDTIPALPRLRREVHAIARGEKVDNGILNSVEQFGGAGEFGVDGYRMVLPYDDPNAAYHSYGKDTVTTVDKLLRAGNYAQGILSGWRMIHAVQQRAVAEQITLKAIRYIRDGLESKALEDMGFTKAVQAKLKRDLPNMVEYDERGRVKVFDLTKATDTDLAATFAQSVLRGTNQIIQGQFIGETGKWAHDGWLKMFTQFRTFPLVAMEKQWARQRHNHGLLGAIGLLAGSIAAVSPIIMLRVAIQSVGRPDQEEYLEEKLQPANIARMALNYVAMAGLAGDLLDAVSAVAPDGLLGDETGARSGGARGAVGNLFAPSLGYVDDAYKAMQDADNPHKWAQLLPMSRLPFVVPLLNTLRNED